jgi:hypothetical protein
MDSAQPDYAVKRGLPEIPDQQIFDDPLESGDDALSRDQFEDAPGAPADL